MTDAGWVVTPKDAPAELAEGYPAPPFTPEQVAAEYTSLSEQRPVEPEPLRNDPFLVPVLEKLDQASLETLSRILGGWPISSDD